MTKAEYFELYEKVKMAGYSREIDWARSLVPCLNAGEFTLEAIWVIINAGMKAQVARNIEQRIYRAIDRGEPINSAFGHEGKVKAIEYIIENHQRLFDEYLAAQDKLVYLETLPWIGPITKYHLAKNLGLDMVKPDRHLVRIARKEEKTPLELCKEISQLTGDRLALVDTVLWRAANLGMI